MVKLIGGMVVILALAITLILAGAQYNESAASREYARGQARAMVIEAQGQARLDTAVSVTAMVVSIAPIALIATGSGLALAVMWMAFLVWQSNQAYRPLPDSQKVLERQVVYVLQPGQSRREFYKTLPEAYPVDRMSGVLEVGQNQQYTGGE